VLEEAGDSFFLRLGRHGLFGFGLQMNCGGPDDPCPTPQP